MKDIIKEYPSLVIEKDGVIQGFAYAIHLKERHAYDWSCFTKMRFRKKTI